MTGCGRCGAAVGFVLYPPSKMRSKSTVSRELKRNRGGRGYRPKQANAFAKERQQAKSLKITY
jgi:hypothetical protein